VLRFAPLVLALASALVTACFPDFGFGPGEEGGGDVTSSRAATGTGQHMNVGGDGGSPTNGGGPGQGGIPGHGGDGPQGGDEGQGGSTTTGVVAMPTVWCGDGNSVLVECAAGEHCCFSSVDPFYDECGAAGSCNDYVLSCNEPGDCPTGTVCCADESLGDFAGTISCVTTCNDKKLCNDVRDCESGQTCSQYFADSYAPEYAPEYKVCKP
jgi:hypothetical protein